MLGTNLLGVSTMKNASERESQNSKTLRGQRREEQGQRVVKTVTIVKSLRLLRVGAFEKARACPARELQYPWGFIFKRTPVERGSKHDMNSEKPKSL